MEPQKHLLKATPDTMNSVQENEKLKVGIVYADEDLKIAERYKRELIARGCEVALANYYAGGEYKIETMEKFIENQNLIFWIASPTSVADEKLVKAAGYTAQFAAKVKPDLNITFVCVKPREHLDAKVKLFMDASSPLIEDENFNERMKEIIDNVKNKVHIAGLQEAEEIDLT